jgi:hypothetical protein
MAPAGSNKVPVIKLNSLVTLVLGLMLAITLAWASVRYKAEFDWTREGRHSLSEAGIRILSQLSRSELPHTPGTILNCVTP